MNCLFFKRIERFSNVPDYWMYDLSGRIWYVLKHGKWVFHMHCSEAYNVRTDKAVIRCYVEIPFNELLLELL